MIDDVYLDAEMKSWEQASDNDCEQLMSLEPQYEGEVCDKLRIALLENKIRAAIDKLNGVGMPQRVRDAIIILESVVDVQE